MDLIIQRLEIRIVSSASPVIPLTAEFHKVITEIDPMYSLTITSKELTAASEETAD